MIALWFSRYCGARSQFSSGVRPACTTDSPACVIQVVLCRKGIAIQDVPSVSLVIVDSHH